MLFLADTNNKHLRLELGDIDRSVLDDFMAQLDQETEWENLKYDM